MKNTLFVVMTCAVALTLGATAIVELPTVSLPKIEINAPAITTPSQAPDELKTRILPKLDESVTSIEQEITTPTCPDVEVKVPNADLNRFFISPANFRDPRNLNYIAGSADWVAWSTAVSQYANNSYYQVPFTRAARVIAEVRPPRSFYQQEILRQNIKFYKSRGYDTVLLVVTQRDSADEVRDACIFIRHYGMKIWFVFSGRERLDPSSHPDPIKLKAALAAAAPYAECFMLSWRRTSAHLLLQDPAYMKFLIGIVREVNPDLPVLGELYYGEYYSKENGTEIHGLATNLDNCCAGAVINGLGTARTDFINAPKLLRKQLPAGANALVLTVIGERPYYRTRGRYIGWEQALIDKRRIEEIFLENGGTATITMSDDGSDGRYHTDENNNLSETLYNQL